MPDLGNFSLLHSSTSALSSSSSVTQICCAALKPTQPEPTLIDGSDWDRARENRVNGAHKEVGVKVNGVEAGPCKLLEEHVRDWVQRKVASGWDMSRCFLPFLVGARRMGECLICHCYVCPGEEVLCSVRNCKGVYHLTCAKRSFGVMHVKKFKCPQHECYICKQKFQWRCTRCSMASHDKCAAWPNKVIHLKNPPGRAVCWRHSTNWLLEKKEAFNRLPLPYIDEEFKLDSWAHCTKDESQEGRAKDMWTELKEENAEPPPYVHIRRNVYLVKKKLDNDDFDVGCTTCSSKCCEDCVCRVQLISCSKACRCPEDCTNRPFRKEKKIKIVKTAFCGWGVEAAEPINKGDFVIEYIGEVIDDALCEQRLWDMKYRGVQNFYMCEIRKDFTIDATFKGNLSRFLNHSCDPNCLLEKWQVEGETRVGVFAARAIKVGEPLTYDYRFVQFGPEVKCYCGAPNCQGYLGTKRKVCKLNICWGAKRRRSSITCLAIVTI